MNDPQRSCEHRWEAISLLAAECLTGKEEYEVREHLAVCDSCRQRYEEITSVCAHVRTSKPVVEPERVLAMERCLQHLSLPVKHASQNHRSVVMRVAMLAAAVLVLIGVSRPFAFQRTDDGLVRPVDVVQVQPRVAPRESSDLRLPTLLALRQAAAESEDSFDRILARYSEPTLLEPLNRHTFSLESFR